MKHPVYGERDRKFIILIILIDSLSPLLLKQEFCIVLKADLILEKESTNEKPGRMGERQLLNCPFCLNFSR